LAFFMDLWHPEAVLAAQPGIRLAIPSSTKGSVSQANRFHDLKRIYPGRGLVAGQAGGGKVVTARPRQGKTSGCLARGAFLFPWPARGIAPRFSLR
jgi:hypothetical protein